MVSMLGAGLRWLHDATAVRTGEGSGLQSARFEGPGHPSRTRHARGRADSTGAPARRAGDRPWFHRARISTVAMPSEIMS